ncbi:MAG TPA: carboxypeptidase-like regulatory domain-containing protein, partial [Gemmatimonadaceae bacterium]|nr:carboxypeptidase-like regulatory domain-containing protein [Gemmatimonadaceae bacterium]
MATRFALLLVGSMAIAPAIAAQAPVVRPEVIQGHATTDGSVPLPDAVVVVTMAPDRLTFQARTDSTGFYRVAIANGTGDYLVHVGKIGYTEFRKRVTRSATGISADSLYTVDAKLPAIAQKLAAVQVQAQKLKPQRGPEFGAEVGSSEQFSNGVNGALSPDMAGDLASLAATVPGISTIGGGISALGLGPGANATTLNGMAFPGADVPRDANVRTRVTLSTYDPARGWFSGAQTAVELAGGGLFTSRRGHLTVDAPQLQYTDPVSRRLGGQVTNFNASYGTNGSMSDDDNYFYNYAIQGGRSSADATSLLTADPLLLEHAGVSPDSVQRLRTLLAGANVPLVGSVASPSRINDNASVIARFDHAPYDWKNLKASKTTEALTMYAKVGRSQAMSLGPTATPSHGGDSWQGIGMIQGLYSTFIHDDYLAEGHSGFSYSENHIAPYLRLPDGRVLVTSTFPDATSGSTNLAFGGNSGLTSDIRSWTWENIGSMSAYTSAAKPHRLKLDTDVRLDGYSQDLATNQFGTFSFNSLSDLQAGHPAAYTRTLNDPTRTGSEWNAFLSAGDMWRVSPTFQLLGGVRLEGNRFNGGPAYNPAVDQAFGLRTDHTPDTWGLSPRVGFTWLRRPGGSGFMINPIGQFTLNPTMYIRGGIGEFRNMLPASLLSTATVSTGLPNGIERITCLGAAAPNPDWSSFAADPSTIPSSCVSGVPNPAFTDAAPSVQLFDSRYTAGRSWRGNLSVSTNIWKLVTSVEGVYALNLNQPGIMDLNFRGAQQFTVADEGRPVFVPASAIDPGTGGVSNVPARVDSRFGRVLDNVSDLRSRTAQLTGTVSANTYTLGTSLYTGFSYTLANNRAEHRGFDGGAFEAPTALEWSRGDFDIRHSFLLSFGLSKWGFTLSGLGRLSSGVPFTPIVGSDVNGDGLANDRAFIFNPATAHDPNLGAALNTLLSTTSGSVHDCLLGQLGAAAGRNSCQGPWTTSLNAQLSVYGARLHLPKSIGSVSLNLTNPLGGLDQLLHGSDHLRGWGTQPFADPVLYNVRGFDASSNRFIYDVNPRFGTTSPALNTLRAPFRLTLDVSMSLGRSITEQQLERWLNPGRGGRRGPKLTVDELEKRYMRTVLDPFAPILRQSDSLLLTPPQLDSMRAAQKRWETTMSAHWNKLATYLGTLPDEYDVADAYKHQEDAS